MSQPISEYLQDEIIRPSKIDSGSVLRINPTTRLTDRRIYGYIEAKTTSTNFFLAATITCHKAGSIIAGPFPMFIGDFTGLTNVNQSICSIINGGGSPVGDSAVVRLAQPFNIAVQSVTLQPLRINGVIDEIRLNIISALGGISGYRAFLGCLSTQY